MTLILDANVVGKLFLNEDDRATARDFIAHLAQSRRQCFAPSILAFEVYGIAIHYGIEVSLPRQTLDRLTRSILTLIEPDGDLWARAYQIAQSGHPKSGFPSLADSLYHALAVDVGGTFVTADKRHLAKTKSIGHAVHLQDWRSAI